MLYAVNCKIADVGIGTMNNIPNRDFLFSCTIFLKDKMIERGFVHLCTVTTYIQCRKSTQFFEDLLYILNYTFSVLSHSLSLSANLKRCLYRAKI